MHICVCLVYNLETGKRTSRFVEVFDPRTDTAIESELPKQLLLPTRLPQEWLPAALRTGMSGPVRRWTDRSLFEQDATDAPAQGA
jgi:hypothetical protein